jgi:hypothetical protein
VAERSHVAECQSQLEVTISRAEKAEQQLQHGVHLPDQLQQLQQQQADAFRTAREEEYQQRVALQEQLARYCPTVAKLAGWQHRVNIWHAALRNVQFCTCNILHMVQPSCAMPSGCGRDMLATALHMVCAG